jgi:hypothetical protein
MIPAHFAHRIGRIVFAAGCVEFLLGRMLSGGSQGLSGLRLIKAVRVVDHGAVQGVIDGYEQLLGNRNHLVHGTYQVSETVLMVWHFHPGGQAITSHPYTVEALESLAASWENLADAAHRALHAMIDPR